jgi:flavin-dependent dehydrogenase
MIRHAEAQGVKVYEETRVESISFENDGDPKSSRPIAATWKRKTGETGTIKFDWLIDASGRQGIMSSRYLENRLYREGLRNVAAYGYWKGVKVFEKGGPRSNAPWFECLTGK